LASGQGAVPASVSALVHGVNSMITWTRARLALTIALLVGVLGSSAAVLTHASQGSPKQAQASLFKSTLPLPDDHKEKATEADPKTVALKGRILDPEGKPAGGASVRFWTGNARQSGSTEIHGMTDKDGRFILLVPAQGLQRDGKLIVSKAGHAPG